MFFDPENENPSPRSRLVRGSMDDEYRAGLGQQGPSGADAFARMVCMRQQTASSWRLVNIGQEYARGESRASSNGTVAMWLLCCWLLVRGGFWRDATTNQQPATSNPVLLP